MHLVGLDVGDSDDDWSKAGFDVVGHVVSVGGVAIRLRGSAGSTGSTGHRRGLSAWAFAEENNKSIKNRIVDLNGIDTVIGPEVSAATSTNTVHPNGVSHIDHIVLSSNDLRATIDAFAQHLNLHPKRIVGDNHMAFFKAGPTVIEVVQSKAISSISTSTVSSSSSVNDFLWVYHVLGPLARKPKNAVQGRGRRIVTLNTGER
ncbi:hypothetical protein BCR33DRAFT_716910 [Rhizoclosmatium globosum]|uniref:Glyoxalase/fosfomycin resistance/dioxygenase domain-containing protein n=1 Tax=Rhizoclosmatium globosum TaxID=329046 RepID=A0A1Y2CDG9_9FUNG|nr:hypothetical protein BCR33DRAFT_716910 [Rhizoclosmatium globosum]|eukprot:ORY44355.1 hypothetical protein BCR33DRAFT_716910 [Rhizoclosmatium globosum]